MLRRLLPGITLGTLVFTTVAAGCASIYSADKVLARPKAPAQTLAQRSNSATTLEQSTFQLVNKYRQSKNLPPLVLDSRISAQARAHSQAMASGQVPFSHQGFEQRVKVISQAIPYRASAENVAYNQGYSTPDQQAVKGWINSPGHEKNMVGNYDLTGIGVAKNAKGEYYFTQLFIKKR